MNTPKTNSRWVVLALNCPDSPTYFLNDEELRHFPEAFELEMFEAGWTEEDCGAKEVIAKAIETKEATAPQKFNPKIDQVREMPGKLSYTRPMRTGPRMQNNRMSPISIASQKVLEAEAAGHNRGMHALNGNNPVVETRVTETVTTRPKQKKPKKQKKQKQTAPAKRVAAKAGKQHAQLVKRSYVKELAKPIARIVESLTLPMEYPAHRVKVDYENVETAIASPNSVFDADFIQNETVGFFFRDPIRSSITTVALPAECGYNAIFHPTEGTSDLQQKLLLAGPLPNLDTFMNPVFFEGLDGNPIQPHTEKLYLGTSKTEPESRWFPMTVNAANTATVNLTLTGTGTMSTDQAWVTLYRYNGTGNPDIADSQNLTLEATESVTLSCNADTKGTGLHYYAVVVSTSLLVVDKELAIEMNIKQTGTIFGQKPLPGWDNNKSVASTIAINGFSALLSNSASAMSRNGRLIGVQVPANIHPTKVISLGGTYDNLGKYASRWQGDAAKGIYGFYRPSGVQSFFFNEYQPDEDETFKMEAKNDYLAICASCVAGTDGTGQNLYWTNAYAVEFRTADTWRVQRQATSTPRDLEGALEAMSKIPQWHENPIHFKSIAKAIGGFVDKAVGAVNKYGPLAAQLAAMAA